MTRRALTLIEALAIMVVLGITAGLAAATVASTTDAVTQRSLVAQLQSLDARARAAARVNSEAVVLEIAGTEFSLRSIDRIAVTTLPEGSSLVLRSGHSTIRELLFDRRGRTTDYTAQLTSPTGGQATWAVAGLTGHVTSEDQTP